MRYKYVVVQTLEESFVRLLEISQKRSVTIRMLFDILSGRGYPLLLVLLSLPFCQPLQIPGFSTPFGLIIAFMGVRLGFGHRIWLPQSVLDKKLSRTFLQKAITNCLWLIHKARRFLRPRLVIVCRHPFFHAVNGAFIALLGILLALPLPIPLTNLVAAWSILCISLGLAEDDGVVVCIGYGITLLCLLFFFVMIVFFRKMIAVI